MNPLLLAIRWYRAAYRILAMSGLWAPVSGCRQWPTCSQYAEQAILTHGTVRGTLLAFRRVAYCHPWARIPSHVH